MEDVREERRRGRKVGGKTEDMNRKGRGKRHEGEEERRRGDTRNEWKT